MLKNLQAEGVGPSNEYDIEFGPRLNIFTGDNGLGKSFILDIAWWCLTHHWFDQIALPHRAKGARISATIQSKKSIQKTIAGSFNTRIQKWNFEGKGSHGPDLAIYVGLKGYAVFDSLRNQNPLNEGRRSSMNISGHSILPDIYRFSDSTLWKGLNEKDTGKVLCNGLIRDVVNWQLHPTKAKYAAFSYLTSVLQTVSCPTEIMTLGEPKAIFFDEALEHPMITFPYGDVPAIFCSAAVQRILGLAYLLVWTWTEHIRAAQLLEVKPGIDLVLLIDELESHLHPRWQRFILTALVENLPKILSKDLRVQMLLTTHSPLILASAEPFFNEEADRLFLFSLDGKKVRLEREPWVTQGDAVGWLTSPIFGLSDTRSAKAQEVIARASNLMDKNVTPSSKLAKNVHQELIEVLADDDPFWQQWHYFTDNFRKI